MILKRLIVFMAALLAVINMSLTAYASSNIIDKDERLEQAYNSHFIEYTGQQTREWNDYVLDGKLTIRENTEIVENSHVYLKSGSVLVIKNGAKLSVNGSINIEPDAKLYITNGSVDVGFVCTNYGRIIIRKNGTLEVKRGDYISNGFSRLTLDGKAVFGNVSLDEVLAVIQKQDSGFDLSKCFVYYFGEDKYAGLIDRLEIHHRIWNVMTDYCYKMEKTDGTGKLKSYNFYKEKIYNTSLRKKVKAVAKKYLSENKTLDRFASNRYLFDIQISINYSFKTDDLTYEEAYFEYGLSDISKNEGIWYEQCYIKNLKI